MQKDKFKKQPKEFVEKVIKIDRISRTVKGGRRIRFRALVAIGDEKSRVGVATAKAVEVVTAITKAVKKAEKNMIEVPIVNGTIPHQVRIKSGSALILLKPAKKGTSIIAGGSVRSILELAGVKNVVGKIFGTSNKMNNVKATFEALQSFKYIPKTDKSKKVESKKKQTKKTK